jgi:hypothetical protein
MQRIRLQQAADQAARMQETEARRPEYMKRAKRRLSDPDGDALSFGNQENAAPSLGVVDSPAKGRRITLFQETSEESFEQSLLAGGYPSYGHTPSYGEPSTPQPDGKAGLSQRAVEWIQQATPGYQPPNTVKDLSLLFQPTEEEMRKRRRLEAFRDHNLSESYMTRKLYPVLVQGLGRVLLDTPLEELPLLETPTKKRSRRKRGGVTDSPSRRRIQNVETTSEPVVAAKPNWLDQAFPWSVRAKERDEIVKMEEEEKLKWIERYLERDSDEDEEEDQSLGLPPSDAEDPIVRRGRGKMVPLPLNPAEQSDAATKQDKVYFPSDPADARAALLSKRSVRALAFRRRQTREETKCPVCREEDNGDEQVQCDECQRWYHAFCIGVDDLSELGREDEPWYCRECLGLVPVGSSSPIYVPTDDRPLVGARRDPLFFQGAGAQESPPGISWNAPRVPKTPVRGTRSLPHQPSSRSSWADSSDVGPITPSTAARSVCVYRTPSAFDMLEEPFDPTATPSRSLRTTGPFTTPKATHIWPHRTTFQTPSRRSGNRRIPNSGIPYAFQLPEDYDDSPVRRTQPREEKIRVSKYSMESPLASRSTSFPQIVRSGSPLARIVGSSNSIRA